MKAVLVGEAYGQHEEMFRHPLVGPSGCELGRMLHEAEIAPPLPYKYPSELDMIKYWKHLKDEDILHVTNVFNTRPVDNNIDLFFDRETGDRSFGPIKIKSSVKYVIPEFAHHVTALWKELNDIKPNLIVAMGNRACWAVLGLESGITKVRGTVSLGREILGQTKVLPTIHPAYLLYEGGWRERPILVADLMKAKRQMEFPEIRRSERWVTVAETLEEVRQWFNRSADYYAIDIESGYALYSGAEIRNMPPHMRHLLSEQISMVSFARKPSDMLVVQFMKRGAKGLNFWPNVEDEVEAWRLIINRGLKRNVPKIFQNGIYDIGRFLSYGIVPTMCYDDTMLRHHAKYPEMLKSLGFLASIYLDEIAYKIAYGAREELKRDA